MAKPRGQGCAGAKPVRKEDEMVTSKHVNLISAKDFCKREYNRTHKDQLVFLYTEDGGLSFCQEWDYRYGYGQGVPESDVYAEVFYGTGERPDLPGHSNIPEFEVEYF